MRNLIQKFMIFMQGRYGFDTMNKFLAVLSLVLYFLLIITRFILFLWVFRLIIGILLLASFALLIFRFLSHNINKRSAENRAFLKLYNPVKSRVKLSIQKFRDRKEFKYLKCPVCKAQLRVKNKKGMHTVRCPRCGSEFDKKI